MDTTQFKYQLGQIVSLNPARTNRQCIKGRVVALHLYEGGSRGYLVSTTNLDGILRHTVDEAEISDAS
jgi:hypothetical protein